MDRSSTNCLALMGLALLVSCHRNDALTPADAGHEPELVADPDPPLAERGFIKKLNDACRPVAIAYFEATERLGRCDPSAGNACSYELGYRDECGCARPTNPDAAPDVAARQAALTAWKVNNCPGGSPFEHFCEACPSSTDARCAAEKNGRGSYCRSKQ